MSLNSRDQCPDCRCYNCGPGGRPCHYPELLAALGPYKPTEPERAQLRWLAGFAGFDWTAGVWCKLFQAARRDAFAAGVKWADASRDELVSQ